MSQGWFFAISTYLAMAASTDATNCAPGINTKDSPENEVNRQNLTKEDKRKEHGTCGTSNTNVLKHNGCFTPNNLPQNNITNLTQVIETNAKPMKRQKWTKQMNENVIKCHFKAIIETRTASTPSLSETKHF